MGRGTWDFVSAARIAGFILSRREAVLEKTAARVRAAGFCPAPEAPFPLPRGMRDGGH